MLAELTATIKQRIRRGLMASGFILERQIKKNLSGPSHTRFPENGNPYPGVLSGTLKGSVSAKMDADGMAVRIGPGGLASPYAAIQEFGGKAGRNLATTIPARPYVRPAWEQQKDTIIAKIQAELVAGL